MAAFFKGARRVLEYSFVLLFSKGLTLIASYMVAVWVDDTEFGYYTMAQAVFLTAVAVFGFASSSAYVRYFYSDGATSVVRALRRPYVVLLVACVATGGAVLTMFAGHRYYVWFALLPLCGFLSTAAAAFNSVYRCANDLVGYSIAELGRPAVVFVAMVFFVVMRPRIPVAGFYVIALAAGFLIVLGLSIFRSRSAFGEAPNSRLDERTVVWYLIPLVAVQVMALVNNVGDRYILTGFVSIEEIGRYGKAYLVGSSVGMLMDSFSLLWEPFVVRRRGEFLSRISFWASIAFWTAIVSSVGLLALAYVVFVSRVSVWTLDHSILALGLIVLAAFVARVGYQIYVPVLNAFDRTGLVARVSLIGTLGGLVTNFALIPVIGVFGAAFATWVAFVLFSLLAFDAVRKTRVAAACAEQVHAGAA